MKWIGQHIYDLVSRFRDDVFLENISTGTIASGAHLGLDSNNKIVKAIDGGGDLTSIVAGTGLSGTSLTGPIPTLNVDAAQTQITSVGTIGTGTWQGTAIHGSYVATLNQDTTGEAGTVATIAGLAPNTATTQATQGNITTCSSLASIGTITTGVWNATVIASAKMATGTSSAQGALELATTAEADTGTDTARAVTPAGLKSHIDARYSYQYIAFLADSDAIVDNQFIVPTVNGISNHTWNVDTDLDYTGTDAVTIGHANAHITMNYGKATASIIVPQACDLVGFYAVARNEITNGNAPGVGIFVSEESDVDWGGTGNWDATLRAYAVSDGTGNERRQVKLDGMLATPFAMTTGDLITPAVVAPTGDQVKTTITLVLRTLIA